MTTLTVNTISTRETRGPLPSVAVAGVDWPLYKVRAVVVALVLAGVVGTATGSGEITVWAVTVATAAVWWIGRILDTRRCAVEPAA